MILERMAPEVYAALVGWGVVGAGLIGVSLALKLGHRFIERAFGEEAIGADVIRKDLDVEGHISSLVGDLVEGALEDIAGVVDLRFAGGDGRYKAHHIAMRAAHRK